MMRKGSGPGGSRTGPTAEANGWTLLFADAHPHAGGPDHCAAYLANADGYEVELVAAG